MATGGDDAITASLRIISYRPRSVRELTEKLKEKGFAPGDIVAAIEHLTELGYLDDDRYAASLAESRTRNKGWGPAKIAADLARRGLGKEAIERAIAPLGPLEQDTARTALEKWGRKSGAVPPLKGKSYEKAARHLKARGFSAPVIMAAIKGYGLDDRDTD